MADRIGETCDHTASKASDRKQCEVHLLCNADKKCACSDTTKEHTFKVRDDGVEKEMRRCVDKEGKAHVKKFDQMSTSLFTREGVN